MVLGHRPDPIARSQASERSHFDCDVCSSRDAACSSEVNEEADVEAGSAKTRKIMSRGQTVPVLI